MKTEQILITVTAGELAEVLHMLSAAINNGCECYDVLAAKVRVRHWIQPTLNTVAYSEARRLLDAPPPSHYTIRTRKAMDAA